MPYARVMVKPTTSKSLPERFSYYPPKKRLFQAKLSNDLLDSTQVWSISSVEWDNTLTNSTNIQKNRSRRDQTTSFTNFSRIPDSERRRSTTHYSRTRRIKIYICLMCSMFFLIGIGILVFAILYRPKSSAISSFSATLTTTTTTTFTTATTTTSTSSTTTSTSTTTTSTTETTSTTDSTTSDTTTTTTTDTTTVTACYSGDDYAHLVGGGQRQIKNLQVGDRIWGLSDDGQHLIEDEIMCIPHAGPYSLTEFYTFITIDGHTLSVTARHYLIVASDTNPKRTIIKSASTITLNDRLILVDRSIALEKILYSKRIGYYSPITLSGYLLVNNISTSVYSELFSGTHEFFYQLSAPARVYYRLTRWVFGKDYIPFVTSVNEELHPISVFIIDHYEAIRLIFIGFSNIMPMIFVILIIYFILIIKNSQFISTPKVMFDLRKTCFSRDKNR